jgi:hypothetical protein
MKNLRFEWDEAKNKANIQKHGVSFEDRFLLLGLSAKLRLLLVCHSFEVNFGLIRIISCRKAKGN